MSRSPPSSSPAPLTSSTLGFAASLGTFGRRTSAPEAAPRTPTTMSSAFITGRAQQSFEPQGWSDFRHRHASVHRARRLSDPHRSHGRVLRRHRHRLALHLCASRQPSTAQPHWRSPIAQGTRARDWNRHDRARASPGIRTPLIRQCCEDFADDREQPEWQLPLLSRKGAAFLGRRVGESRIRPGARHLRTSPSLDQGLEAAARHLGKAHRLSRRSPGFELRIPKPFTAEGFDEFNRGYVKRLESMGLVVDGLLPAARTNVATALSGVSEPTVYAMSYSAPDDRGRPAFVMSGVAEEKGRRSRVDARLDDAGPLRPYDGTWSFMGGRDHHPALTG